MAPLATRLLANHSLNSLYLTRKSVTTLNDKNTACLTFQQRPHQSRKAKNLAFSTDSRNSFVSNRNQPGKRDPSIAYAVRVVPFGRHRSFVANMGRLPVKCSQDTGNVIGEDVTAQEQGDSCQPVVRFVEDVITATRITEGGDAVRLIGPGIDGLGGIGRILTFDEFFIAPNKGPLPFPGEPGIPLESVVYYLEDTSPEQDDDEGLQPRHGIQVHLESLIRLPVRPPSPDSGSGAFSSQLSILTHVREAAFVPSIRLGGAEQESTTSGRFLGTTPGNVNQSGKGGQSGDYSWQSTGPSLGAGSDLDGLNGVKGKTSSKASVGPIGDQGGRSRRMGGLGGAQIRVVAGACEGVRAAPPLDTGILLLDVAMRPGSTVELPLPSSHGALAYILEGVGFFGGSSTGSSTEAAYQNEGHALWLPPVPGAGSQQSILLVRSHQWSQLRFILVGAPT